MSEVRAARIPSMQLRYTSVKALVPDVTVGADASWVCLKVI